MNRKEDRKTPRHVKKA